MKNLIPFFLFLGLYTSAQQEAAQWRFGNKAGLNFQNGAPQSVNNSPLQSQFSTSGISDSLGNLLFYVRGGDLIYNKNNDTMANGINIGGYDGSQSSVVIRKSGSQYYVIVNNTQVLPSPPCGKYAIVDMNLATGLGSVTVSNHSLTPPNLPMVSKLAAAQHCNQKDHWVLFHQGGPVGGTGSNKYYAYLVTSDSIASVPVISSIGSIQPHNYGPAPGFFRGCHKFSPNGKKLVANMPYRGIELYDFDNSTGQLSNFFRLDSIINPASSNSIPHVMGLEFSPDGTKLYASYANEHPFLCQFDLCAGSPTAIAASKTIISFDTISANNPRDLQNAPDGKIYVARGNVTVGAINNPNALGLLCNYSLSAVSLGTITTTPYYASLSNCLPNFVSSYFEQKPALLAFTGTVQCGAANFSIPVICPATGYAPLAYSWNFNDPLSASNTSTLTNPGHLFSANGTYTVKLALQYACHADTLSQTINISGLPPLAVSGKTVICKGESTQFSFTGASSYSLNSLAVTQASSVVQPSITTTYTLSGTDLTTGCKSLKAFKLTVNPCAGFSEAGLQQNIKVYPNPTDGFFTIELEKESELTIMDITGRKIYTSFLTSGKHEIELNKQNKAAGIYFIKVKNKGQEKIIKLVKY